VAAVTAVPGGRSLLGKAGAALSASRRRVRPGAVAAVAAKAREHVVTVAALVAVDIGAFHTPGGFGPMAGWIVTGGSLLALDFAVRG